MISKKSLLALLVSFLLLSACSEAPKQYVNDAPENPNPEQKNIKGIFDEILPEGTDLPEPLPAEDEIARENSKKDIIYGVGAAGITFQTTLAQTTIDGAETRLSKPRVVTDDNYWVYDEGMILYWRTQPPRTTLMFWMTTDYQGKMKVGGEIGNLEMGRDLSQFFPADDPEGQGFIVKLYNALEKMDEGFNCLESSICQIKQFESHYLYLWSKFGMLVSKDRHLIGDIRLFNQSEQGPLGNDFDLFGGAIQVGEKQSVYLGQTWGEAKSAIGFQGNSNTGKSSFSFDYGGIYLGVSKSHFEREYTVAESTEVLDSYYFGNGYNNFFIFGGEYIYFDTLGDGYIFSRSDVLPMDSQDALRLKVGVMENQETFMNQMTDYLRELYIDQNPSALTVSRVTGLNNSAFEREYTGSIVQFDPQTKKGFYVGIDFSNTVGNLTSLEMMSLNDPVNQILLPGYIAGVELPELGSENYSERAKLTELAGFSIGQVIELKEVDYGREEATVVINDEITTRAYFSKHGLLSGIFGNDGKVISSSVHTVYVGDLLTALHIVDYSEPQSSKKLAKIVGITTANLYQGVKGLCGFSDMTIQMGISDKDIISKINDEEAKRQAKDKNYNCMRFARKQDDGSGRLGSLYFPENRIKLIFSEQELSEITIYARPSEVE